MNSFRVVFNTYFGASLPLSDRLRHVSDQQPPCSTTSPVSWRRRSRPEGGNTLSLE